MPRSSFRSIALILAVPIVGLLLFAGWRLLTTRVPSAPAKTTPNVASATAAVPKNEPAAAPRHRGDIVLILDDVGFEQQPVERLMRLDPNINFAVLPSGHRADAMAERLHREGFEILCHLPMEPLDRAVRPGPNAVLTSMSGAEIASVTKRNLKAVPQARGVNNHMGSRATADRRVMQEVLAAIPDGMYFVDSMTTGSSVAESVAREMNIRTVSRDVFLDSEPTERAVRKQLAALAATAESRGRAVGIGHLYPVTVKVLEEEIPALRKRGFRFVRASTVVR